MSLGRSKCSPSLLIYFVTNLWDFKQYLIRPPLLLLLDTQVLRDGDLGGKIKVVLIRQKYKGTNLMTLIAGLVACFRYQLSVGW